MPSLFRARRVRPRRSCAPLGALVCVAGVLLAASRASAQNEIVLENELPGNPSSEWDISGAGDESIQGFATDISVNHGETIEFKIDTDAASYRIDIYRLGWYGGDGARFVATVLPSATLPQIQPEGIHDPQTRLLDCGNWGVSASWTVPANAVSGIYLAKLVRTDPEDGRASHIAFIVRDDEGASDILMQTSDTTWQAYNQYGNAGLQSGSSLYPSPGGKASKVSYNRPFTTRGGEDEDWVFNAEFPMLRWLERNGYDVSYSTDVDTDRRGAEILEHRLFISIGHDEYWSRAARENVEAARDAGVHLAFLSGNEIYWKVRWEESVDGASTPYRTLVCYKEGTLGENQCSTKCDPVADVWTGLWRSGCEWTPPADGCEPENALSGQISWVGTTLAMQVPGEYAHLPFWRNTSIADLLPNQSATLGPNTLGYEWDFEQYDAFYPPGRIHMSETTQSGKTHHLSLYRHLPSGALVFGAGSVQWVWGLDDVHDRGNDPQDSRMQQATVNLFADMGVAPATLQANLMYSTLPPDPIPPSSAIAFPLDGAVLESGVPVAISGTASDLAGPVLLVEVSVDGGVTWRPAEGRESWSFTWTPGVLGAAVIQSRAWDAGLGAETPSTGVSVSVTPHDCPCSLWSDSIVPAIASTNDPSAVELGVKFRTDLDGFVSAIRFYKGTANDGAHVGHLWTSGGALLASIAFTGESAEGWQEASFPSPIAVSANTTYIASYHTASGNYAFEIDSFATQGVDNAPLHALADGADGPNGVYHYGASAFPTDTYNSSNYWVDVVFDTTGTDTQPPTVTLRTPGDGALGVPTGTSVSATFNESVAPASIVFTLAPTLGGAPVSASVTYDAPSRTVTLDPLDQLAPSTPYTARVDAAEDLAGNPLAFAVEWTFTTQDPPPPPPDEGPGGPILVIAHPSNRFGRYFAEILRAEGMNAFDVADLPEVNGALLDAHDVVILGETPLDASQAAMFARLGASGRQSDRDAPRCGSRAAPRDHARGRNAVECVPRDRHRDGARHRARRDVDPVPRCERSLHHERSDGSRDALVRCIHSDRAPGGDARRSRRERRPSRRVHVRSRALRRVHAPRKSAVGGAGAGRNRAASLRRSLLRCGGRRSAAGLDRSGQGRHSPSRRAAAASRPTRAGDERGPRAAPSLLVLPARREGGDRAHRRRSLRLHARPIRALPGRRSSGMRRGRLGVRPLHVVPLSRKSDERRRRPPHSSRKASKSGFISIPGARTGRRHRSPPTMPRSGARSPRSIPSLTPSPTERHHCITWSDWATAPKTELTFGIRLDTNYYYWPPAWVQDRPGMFTGSGMPMRFADLDGTMIDVYQVATQMTDESGQSYPFTIDALLDNALGRCRLLRSVLREHAQRRAELLGGGRHHRFGAGARRSRLSRRCKC